MEKKTIRATRYWNNRIWTGLADGPNDFFLLPFNQKKSEIENAKLISREILKRKNEWERIHINYIPSKSPVWQLMVENLKNFGFDVQVRSDRFFYYVDTNLPWENYYKDFLHKRLRDLRGRFNRLKNDNLSFDIHVVKQGINEFLPHLLKLYDERRKSTGQQNAFSVIAHRNMLIEIIPKYEQKGWIQLSYLKGSDGNIWAYQLDFIKDGIQYHYTPAFDENYKYYSPSKILLYETLKKAFDDPNISEFNFMRGESGYKTQFAKENEQYVFIEIYNHLSQRNKLTKLATKITKIRDRVLNIFS